MRKSQRTAAVALAAAITLLFGATTASAQYVGPSAAPNYRSVAEVLKDPVDDTPIVLEGYIVKHLGKDKYTFSDGTSEIRVEIDAKRFPPVPISEKTKVRINGEVDKDLIGSPKIEVEQLSIIQ